MVSELRRRELCEEFGEKVVACQTVSVRELEL
jgi:hypothetical protein